MRNGNEQYSWMEDTKRISIYDIKQVLRILDEAYFLLEEDPEILANGGRVKNFNPKECQNKIYEAIERMETEWADKGLSRIDMAASDLEYAVKQISSLKIDVNLTPENGMW
jgi:hypothetical protein